LRIPIINSPFEAPTGDFHFDEIGITDRLVESRRLSAYFMPIPTSKKKSDNQQLVLDTGWARVRDYHAPSGPKN
jgi:type III restriction enzyme